MSEMYHVARKAAETMEGKCATRRDPSEQWCSWHDARWFTGRAVCERMADYIRLAEQAIEDAEPIIRADEQAKDRQRVSIQMIRQDAVDGALADLRAQVQGLPPHGAGERMFVWRDDVLALLPEEKP